MPAPAAGTPSDTESPTEIVNGCASGTAHTLNAYVPGLAPLPDTVNTYVPAAIHVGLTSLMPCCVNPYWYEPPDDRNDQ